MAQRRTSPLHLGGRALKPSLKLIKSMQKVRCVFSRLGPYQYCCMMDIIVLVNRRLALQILKLWCVDVCDARGFLNVRGGPEESYRSLSLSLCLTLEQSIERQVLHSQCRRLEVHHYNLSLTAEQLSHSMGVRNTNANLF